MVCRTSSYAKNNKASEHNIPAVFISGSLPERLKARSRYPFVQGTWLHLRCPIILSNQLCSNMGKVLEKIVNSQLTAYLSNNNLMHVGQHGITSGKSNLTNILTFEAFIAIYMLAGHSYDIISIDFIKAFEEISHVKVIQELTNKGIKGSAINGSLVFY